MPWQIIGTVDHHSNFCVLVQFCTTHNKQPHTTTTPQPPNMASSSPTFEWECGACSAPNKDGKYCIMCAAPRTKRQAVAATTVPDMAAESACAPAPSRHPSGIILDVVGTAGTDHGHSCEEHACCGDVLENDVLVKLRRKQILVPDNIAGQGKMKEETAITVNWVSNGIDCCCVGFLPRTFAVQGSVWDGVICQVVEVFQKTIPPRPAVPSGITIRGLRTLLLLARLTCHLASALFQRKRTREWMGGGKGRVIINNVINVSEIVLREFK
jgi:hypothetical protein